MSKGIDFKYSKYQYNVRLGTVMDADAISWKLTAEVTEWRDAKRLADMWHSHEENPAVGISVVYTDYE